ncbi:PRCC domain-containing protein [Aspergillus undulatus]|uniref:PRCC domain-containing protein n=1 Tax=Aspergillus undulatus TaxID=1810928 RepID=UPI003CCD5C3A
MVLVAYSDSEASDSEHENNARAPPPAAKPTASATAMSTSTSKTIVDKSNPRKIRVALPDINPEASEEREDGPARKKPRIGGGGGGLFAGFSSFLPAPKRPNATAEKETKSLGGGPGPARKVFSLKTGAAPGFDREADEEMKRDMAFESLGTGGGDGDDDETIPKVGSLTNEEYEETTESTVEKKKPEEVVLKGNPMMFKPLSVARTGQKKKRTMPIIPPPLPQSDKNEELSKEKTTTVQPATPLQKPTAPPPAPKPKVSLFSLSTEDTAAPDTSKSAQGSTYEPLVYTNENAPAAGPAPEAESGAAPQAPAAPEAQTLDYIADDLNLSRSQRRQLFGRNADASSSRILHFNTDKEYVANQEMAHKDLAATQHNPVRAIAPGKHTLQQLVNAASTQKEALEESFATGKRNKKEAGARYGW